MCVQYGYEPMKWECGSPGVLNTQLVIDSPALKKIKTQYFLGCKMLAVGCQFAALFVGFVGYADILEKERELFQ